MNVDRVDKISGGQMKGRLSWDAHDNRTVDVVAGYRRTDDKLGKFLRRPNIRETQDRARVPEKSR